MCQELTDELAAGKAAATTLAEHLLSMGAAKASIPGDLDGKRFMVTAEWLDASPTAAPQQRAATFFQGVYEDTRDGTRHGLVFAWALDAEPTLAAVLAQARLWLAPNPNARLAGLMEVDSAGCVILPAAVPGTPVEDSEMP